LRRRGPQRDELRIIQRRFGNEIASSGRFLPVCQTIAETQYASPYDRRAPGNVATRIQQLGEEGLTEIRDEFAPRPDR
jgi:hypothetical protein